MCPLLALVLIVNRLLFFFFFFCSGHLQNYWSKQGRRYMPLSSLYYLDVYGYKCLGKFSPHKSWKHIADLYRHLPVSRKWVIFPVMAHLHLSPILHQVSSLHKKELYYDKFTGLMQNRPLQNELWMSHKGLFTRPISEVNFAWSLCVCFIQLFSLF